MKKIFVMLYARENLGDDLFLKLLLDRYPNVHFYINIQKKYAKVIKKYRNITILKDEPETFENRKPEEYDGYIYIGGSIFMEGGRVYNIDNHAEKFMKECKEKNIPFFFISSNFGPYKSEEYLNLAKKIYTNCESICFRDKYSYDLFKNIETVHYAPDAVFTHEINNIKTKKNSVGISVIDLEIRNDLKEKEETYYTMLAKNITNYIEKGLKVFVFSFCKSEGDERAINKLKKYIPYKYKKNIKIIKYNGNINKFLKTYKSMQYMICSRFHAMILSILCKQKIYIMSYSKKIDNVIKDLNFNFEILKFTDIKENTDISIDKFIQIKNIENIIENSQKQFDNSDKFLKG